MNAPIFKRPPTFSQLRFAQMPSSVPVNENFGSSWLYRCFTALRSKSHSAPERVAVSLM